MTDTAALDRLAELAGVEPDYWDIWGNHHQIGAPSKRRILAALGYPADSDSAIAASISRIEEDDWRRPLPPVLVLRADQPLLVPVVVAADAAARRISIVVSEENGTSHEVPFLPADSQPIDGRRIDDREMQRYQARLPFRLPLGYHSLRIADVDHALMRLIVVPDAAYLPPQLAAGRTSWGISTQLYSLQGSHDWGIGDFSDLGNLVDVAAGLHASVIGVNPLHALFPQEPERASPYSPSSRLFLNPLYIDVEAVPEYRDTTGAALPAAEVPAGLQPAANVDYTRVTEVKRAILEQIYRRFRAAGSSDRAAAFRRFCDEQGGALQRFALFEALTERFDAVPWQEWPPAFRHPDSPEVDAFGHEHADRIEFHKFLQWLADGQLAEAQMRAHAHGLEIGLYRDLAVGCAIDSADAWTDQQVIVQQAKVGCPPDPFNMLGQDWGVPPLHPHRLRQAAYEPFIAILRANMQHAGALRIDHVMGLMHLFWIPATGVPAEGAYVRYPFDDLLGVLALESQRNRCLVVGEDLGTVPEGFRERMARINVLSYRVLYFEKDGDRFKRPAEYPALALACVTTHDLATLQGFWHGSDIDLRQRLGLYPSADAEANERAARWRDRVLLLQALAAEGLLPPGVHPDDPGATAMTPALAASLHAYLAHSPAAILLTQIDDLTAEIEQINVPGTVDERPNWRRRLGVTVDAVPAAPVARALAASLATLRDPGRPAEQDTLAARSLGE
jgi:4-alpha-glucanotransferase